MHLKEWPKNTLHQFYAVSQRVVLYKTDLKLEKKAALQGEEHDK